MFLAAGMPFILLIGAVPNVIPYIRPWMGMTAMIPVGG